MKLPVSLALVALLAGGSALAQSAKSAVKFNTFTQVSVESAASPATPEDNDQTPWTDVLVTTIKTSQQKDLLMQVSLESTLYTDTLVRSSGGTKDTSKASAGVEVRVFIDGSGNTGRAALPGSVTYNKREQTLSATFGGIFTNCTDLDGDGAVELTECDLTPEELQLVLNTTSANSYSFLLADVGSGTHTVRVQARATTGATAQTGSAQAKAWVGQSVVTVEEIRMVKGADVLMPAPISL